MKKKRINSVLIRRQDQLLRRAGISKEELFDLSVVDLIKKLDKSEVDSLLDRLLISLHDKIFENIELPPIDLAEGHQYVIDIFESCDFDEHPEWFYEISVKEFLELEDLEPRKIPFLTYYIKKYVELGTMLEPEYVRIYDDDDEEKYQLYMNVEGT